MLLGPILAAPAPDFAARLWRSLPTARGNVVVSPASVEACLGLLIPAVGPSSKEPLARALGASATGMGAYERRLQARLKGLAGGDTALANAAFFGAEPRPAYVAALAKGYGATAERLRSLEQINGWVKARTKDRIPKLFDQLQLPVSLVLVNALTFDGDWMRAFPAGATKKAPFRGGRTANLMRQKLEAPYGEGAGFRMAGLAYKGGWTRMTVLLPDVGDPAPLLSDGAWRSVIMTDRTVDLLLPRFTARSAPDVETALKAMGLAPLFERIDLTPALMGMGDRISEIAHRTYVKVDEKGTEAAAATGVMMTRGMRVPSPPVVFRVDRPFAFVIQRVETGEVLFEGVIREP